MSATVNGDDGALVAAALAGQQIAFTMLMRRHKDGLYRFVRHYVGDADEAYDLLQDSFVAAWKALPRYDPERPFAVWLRRIALNKCRDWARRRMVRRLVQPRATIDGLEAVTAPDPAPSAETQLIDQEALRRLDKAIAALPGKLKEPLILTTLEGMSQQAVAALLGISVKTVETRVYRARRKLVDALRR